MITLAQLVRIMPHSRSRAATFLDHLKSTMVEFDISTPRRAAAFLAQLGHESGQLLYVQEIASGAAYEGRRDLGNTEPGDGKRFKGHGLIQITGRANHKAVAEHFGKTLDEVVAWLITPEGACRSAGWFWDSRDLNHLADSDEFVKLTKRINGGFNGLADRIELYTRALEVLGAK
jgi:putative chitinase